MIVTVTPNTAIDHTLFVPSLPMNRTTRATQSVKSMAGKPTDASWILAELGISSLALGFAAGATGQMVSQMLASRGCSVDFTWVNGETRLNTVIVCEDGSGQATITTSTLEVEESHIAALRSRFAEALVGATCVVLGGTLPGNVPHSLYADLISMARERHVPVIFDADQPYLSAGLAAGPTYIKPNHHELEALVGHPVVGVDAAYRAGCDIAAQYGTSPIITLGKEGALAILPHATYFIPPLNVKLASSAGAGDAVLAGLAASIHRRQPIEDGLRLGIAAAAAVCMQVGTADCNRADVEALVPQVQLTKYDGLV